MANPSCQTLLNIYNSIVESGQMDRFSAKEQTRILMAANFVIRHMLMYSDEYILDVGAEGYNLYTPYFADLVSLSQSGPVSMEADTEDDRQSVEFWHDGLLRRIENWRWHRQYQAEIIRQHLDDEREDDE